MSHGRVSLLSLQEGVKISILVKTAMALQSCSEAPNRPPLCKELLCQDILDFSVDVVIMDLKCLMKS